MNEHAPKPDQDMEGEKPLDKETLRQSLLDICKALHMDVEEEDLVDIEGKDDNDFLGNLSSLALMHGVDHETFFQALGVPAERIVEFSQETE